MRKKELVSLVEEYEVEIQKLKEENVVMKNMRDSSEDYRINYLTKRLMCVYDPLLRNIYYNRLNYLQCN